MNRGLLALLAAGALVPAACGEDERKATPPPRDQTADRGLRVWAAEGCGSCHSFAPAGATGTIGPDLTLTLRAKSADYIRESIVAPQANVAGGGTSGMPENYAKRIPKRELDALVAFIARAVR